MAQQNKRHQTGRRPEITRNVYNAVRKYDRQSFERWVNHIYDCGYEDGYSGDEAAYAVRQGWHAGHDAGVADMVKIISEVKGIGQKKLAEIKEAIEQEEIFDWQRMRTKEKEG